MLGVGDKPEERWLCFEVTAAGGGGRPFGAGTLLGSDAYCFNNRLKNAPVEFVETVYPVRIEQDSLRPGSADEIHYPRLVVEVLSHTTQNYDRTDKFDLYRGCAALQDYVLVSTRRQSVHVYSRGDDGVWLLRPFGPGDDVLLPGIDFRIPIGAFYEDVELPTTARARCRSRRGGRCSSRSR